MLTPRTGYSFTIVIYLLSWTSEITTNTLNEKVAAIDYLVRRAQAALGIESVGLAIGLVHNGTVAMAKGYGLRNHTDERSRVTTRTLFALASCTKAFTAYACDRLVTVDGSLAWNDLVRQHIPKFRMSNLYTADHVTVGDLLSHTSGLPRHDLFQFHSTFPRAEFLVRLPYLATNYNLREAYQYNNIMYAVVGLVIERVTGRTWEEIVRERIFKPLKMSRSFTGVREVFETRVDDVAVPHSVPRGLGTDSIRSVPYMDIHNTNPAGGIFSCIEDLLRWVQVQLRLTGRSKEMHVPKINIPDDPTTGAFFAYGYGWFLSYYGNRIVVSHDGIISGFVANVLLIPELDTGIVALSNLETLGAFVDSLSLKIADIMVDPSTSIELEDLNEWASEQAEALNASQTVVRWDNSNLASDRTVKRPEQYVGRYKNEGYGVVDVFVLGSKLYVTYNSLRYLLVPKKGLDFFSARCPFPNEYRFECCFVRDSSNSVRGFRFDLELEVPPILFEKEVSSDLFSLKYLESFVGVYGPIEIDVNRFERILVASSGADNYAGNLAPYKRNWFYLKRLLLEFVVEKDVVSQMYVYESELIITYNKTIITRV